MNVRNNYGFSKHAEGKHLRQDWSQKQADQRTKEMQVNRYKDCTLFVDLPDLQAIH